MKNLVYLDGDLVPADLARVPLLDRGYLYGDGLFETMRSYGGRIFALDRHLARLLSSAKELNLELGVGEEQLAQALELTLEANQLTDAYLRLTVSQQCDAPGVESRAAGRFTISAIAHPLPPPPAGDFSIITLDPGTAPSPNLARHKTLSYLIYIQARALAHAGGARDALLLNTAGEITEASTANVFFVIDGRLVTPPLACGLLPGVTRALVLELAQAQGIEAVQQPLRPPQLRTCSECFLTNSIIELAPVTRINGAPVGDGVPGPVWQALAVAYSRATASASDA